MSVIGGGFNPVTQPGWTGWADWLKAHPGQAPSGGTGTAYQPAVTPESWMGHPGGNLTWNPTTHNWDSGSQGSSSGTFWTTPPSGSPPGSTFVPDNPANPSMGGVWKDPSGNPIGGARGPGGDLLVNPPVTTSTPPTSPGTQSAFTPMQQTQQPFDLSSLLNFIPQFMQNQYQSPFQPTQQQGGTGYNLGTIPGWGWGGSP